MDQTARFEAERTRLTRLAGRVLGDRVEAEDVVQQAWLRLHGADSEPDNLPAWLTTVTTRLCLDRLRACTPAPTSPDELPDAVTDGVPDVADDLALAETVGVALQAVLDRLSATERVAFVLHDSFGFSFATIGAILATTPAAARKLASRARAKVRRPEAGHQPADWQVVDAFLTAAREGRFDDLMRLLAPDAIVRSDAAALATGTPGRIDGRHSVAAFFNGAARAALPVFLSERPAAAWFHQGQARVVFDFTVATGRVTAITFRSDPDLLAQVRRRDGNQRHAAAPPRRTATPHG